LTSALEEGEVKLHVSVTSNPHQADISVHGHEVFGTYSMGSHIVYICCVEFQTFGLINCSIFNILNNVFPEILYEPINVRLSVNLLILLSEILHSKCKKHGIPYCKH